MTDGKFDLEILIADFGRMRYIKQKGVWAAMPFLNLKEGNQMKRVIETKMVEEYREHLLSEEKRGATVEKYLRDLRKFVDYVGDRELDKSLVIAYKNDLKERGYKISSINSFLAAANQFFQYMCWNDLKVRLFTVQRAAFCPEKKCLTRQEYLRLVKTAIKKERYRLAAILQTIGATGLRISELRFITVESVKGGMVEIYNKGKVRTVLLSKDLQNVLKQYIGDHQIREGTVFLTSGGRPIDRSNLWREMKALCREADVDQEKVFPHNLRHLFARSFYAVKKDIAMLADLLGHSSIDTTRIYIRTCSREHRKQLNRMGLILESQNIQMW